MLNTNKIHSAINSRNLSDADLARILDKAYTTIVGRMKNDNWLPDEIEKLADYFDKSILYFFDREEKQSMVNEDSPPYGCKQCVEKQKEIDRLNKKIQEVYDKYTDLLEGKNTNARNCG